MSRIELEHPERYWLAVRTDMSWLQDPDVEDRRQRHDDRDDRAWASIAATVQHVMDELAAGRGTTEPVDEDDPEAGEHVVVDVDLDHLNAVDQEIVVEWFSKHIGPIADPWDDRVENGRHRLWNCWQAAPDAVLPVYSAQLLWLDSIPAMNDDFAAGVYQRTMEGIELMPPKALKRNPGFYAELVRVARLGGHVDVMPCRRWSDGERKLLDELDDDPEILPHLFAGLSVQRHDPVPPPGLDDSPPPQRRPLSPAAWLRHLLTQLRGGRRPS